MELMIQPQSCTRVATFILFMCKANGRCSLMHCFQRLLTNNGHAQRAWAMQVPTSPESGASPHPWNGNEATLPQSVILRKRVELLD